MFGFSVSPRTATGWTATASLKSSAAPTPKPLAPRRKKPIRCNLESAQKSPSRFPSAEGRLANCGLIGPGRREADRTGKALADLVARGAFDFQCELACDRHLPFGAHEKAGHFIDRANFVDRQTGVGGLENALVIIGIEPVIGLHRDDVGAKPARIPHQGAGLDAEGLGGVAGGDRAGGIRRRLHDDDRLAAQGRIFLLLARREKGVEIEEQPLDGVVGR
jgi:hypothetical protein